MSSFTTRYEGVDSDHLAWMLVAIDGRLANRMDEVDYRSYEDYYQRAQLRYGAGFPAFEVLDDLWEAGRCLRFQESLHLTKVPPERFRPRRIQPVEVAILGGEDRLMRQVAEGYGIPISPLLADMATPELKTEIRQVTGFFDGQVRDPLDFAGLAALLYSSALAALARDFDDEALLAVRIFRQAQREVHLREPHPVVTRYARLLGMIEAFVKGQDDKLLQGMADAVAEVEPTLRAGMTDEQWVKPPGTPNYLDCSPFCFMALATYRERPLDLAAWPVELAAHRELLETLGTPIERSPQEEAAARARVSELLGQTVELQQELMQRHEPDTPEELPEPPTK
ncbi:MAG: hypothetical protein RBU45_18410 [Myxococcota bacterium]|jgi:hypothetical protein|nr:hypothetical protein [Myxococcota bacterium]